MDDEFRNALRLLGVDSGAQAPGGSSSAELPEPLPPVPVPIVVGGPVLDEHVYELALRPREVHDNRYEQRSWQLLAAARKDKAAIKLKRERDASQAEALGAKQEVQAMVAATSSSSSSLTESQLAHMRMRIVCTGPRKGLSRGQRDSALIIMCCPKWLTL